jgi:hypothetical protein
MLPNYVIFVFNLISCNLTLLSFIVVFSGKFELCLLTNYIAIVFLRVLATGSGLGGKTRTQQVWAWVLFCHPNSLWVWVQVMNLGAGLDSVKPGGHPLPSLPTR